MQSSWPILKADVESLTWADVPCKDKELSGILIEAYLQLIADEVPEEKMYAMSIAFTRNLFDARIKRTFDDVRTILFNKCKSDVSLLQVCSALKSSAMQFSVLFSGHSFFFNFSYKF